MLVALVESYIAIGGGVILLGFGGSRWTTDIASKYLQYALATGLKLMILYLIIGAGQTLFDNALWIDSKNIIVSCLQAAGEALVYAYLAIQIPQIASAMMSGSPSLTAGGMMGATLGAGAAVAAGGATAGRLAAGGVNLAHGAVAGISGLAKAMGAGVSSGLDLGKSGMTLAAHTVGQLGSHGLGLVKGTIGDAIGSARTGFAQKVDHSMGGKIASSIESTRGGGMSGVEMAAPSTSPFSNQSGQGGGTSAPQMSASAQNGLFSRNSSASESAEHASSMSGESGGNSPAGSAFGQSGNSEGRRVSTPLNQSSPMGSSAKSNNTPISATPKTTLSVSPDTPLETATHTSREGDGSTASVTDGNKSSSNLSKKNSRNPLHRRIQELQGYVPQDVAHAATLEIELKHIED